jgi:hypothetical protein
MTGPVNADQAEPHDPDAYKHQALLLKSAHCCRPVLYQERHQFINGLTLYHDGGRVAMLVYLTGKPDGIDSNEIQIKTTNYEVTEENRNG